MFTVVITAIIYFYFNCEALGQALNLSGLPFLLCMRCVPVEDNMMGYV